MDDFGHPGITSRSEDPGRSTHVHRLEQLAIAGEWHLSHVVEHHIDVGARGAHHRRESRALVADHQRHARRDRHVIDGTPTEIGAPERNGLRGEEIPIGARILAVIDCYDALTSDRPYRPPAL